MGEFDSYKYEASANGRYVLSHDGDEVMRGTELEIWGHLHRTQGQSVSYCLQYGGYSIRPEEVKARVLVLEPEVTEEQKTSMLEALEHLRKNPPTEVQCVPVGEGLPDGTILLGDELSLAKIKGRKP